MIRETVHLMIPPEGRGSLALVVEDFSTAAPHESMEISHHVARRAIWQLFQHGKIDHALWKAALIGIVMAYDPRRR